MKLVILMVSKWNRYNFTKFIFVFTWIIIYLFRCWLPLWLQFRHLMTPLKNSTMVEATTTRIAMTHLKNNFIAQATISIHTTTKFQISAKVSNNTSHQTICIGQDTLPTLTMTMPLIMMMSFSILIL